MGYRFSIQNANAVGHLVEGNVITFLEESARSESILYPNLDLLDGLVNHPERDFMMDQAAWISEHESREWLKQGWSDFQSEFRRLKSSDIQNILRRRHNLLLEYLIVLSSRLARCRIKALLLPGFRRNLVDRVMHDRFFLRELVMMHPRDSVLILQIKDAIGEHETAILNSFSKFEKAYQNIESWPGVLVWNENDSLFLKVREESDVFQIFQILKYEGRSLSYLRDRFRQKQGLVKGTYFFHLSDLHFGNQQSDRRKLRLAKILESHISSLEEDATAIPIITGDMVDSPNDVGMRSYQEFSELIQSKGFAPPIQILGNHDVDTGGLFKSQTAQKEIVASLSGPDPLFVLNDLHLAFVKFNSNTGGKFAQGEIGEDQLMNVGNAIDALSNKDDLNFIALLHHHPKEIENPDWYARDWYEALLGSGQFEKTMKLVDAERFLSWIETRGIKLILHGHKHIPKIHNHNGVTIVAAGSATGKIKHKVPGKTFLSYNVIKYDSNTKVPISCTIFAEETPGAGTKNMLIHKL